MCEGLNGGEVSERKRLNVHGVTTIFPFIN